MIFCGKEGRATECVKFASTESCVIEALQWAPYHRITCWTDGEQLEQMNLIALMPSGVVEKFQMSIISNGSCFELVVHSSDSFWDIESLLVPTEKHLRLKHGSSPMDFILKKLAMKRDAKISRHTEKTSNVMTWQTRLPKAATGVLMGNALQMEDGSHVLTVDMYVEDKIGGDRSNGSGLLLK